MRLRGITALAAAATVVVAGLVSPAIAAADPLVGQCYDYPAKSIRATSTTAPAMDCGAQHTGETYYVRTLPDSFGLPSKSSLGGRLSASKPCTIAAMNAYLGLSDRSLPTRFLSVPRFPTDAQWQAGERWMRCDVVLQGGLELKKLQGPVQSFVTATPKEIFNFCTQGEPNAVKTAAFPCTDPKRNWVKLLNKDLGGAGSKFPGARSVEKSTRKLCGKLGNTYAGKSDYPRWWAIWPTAAGWNKGVRTAQCFVPYSQYLEEMAKRAPKPTPVPTPSPTPTPSATA